MAFTFTTLKTSIQDYTSGNKFLTKPTDFLSPFSLSVSNSSNNEFLLYKHVTFIQDFTPNPSTTGVPAYYADWNDTTFILAPTPDSTYTAELHYFYRPTSITTSSDGTSWLGTNAELALLYGSLVEAYTFMKGEDALLALYNNRFLEAIQWLKILGEGKKTRDEYFYDKVRKDVA